MPGQKITLSPRGLYTNVNSLGKIPEGGLLQADNVVISRPGVIESRRGSDTVWFPGSRGLRIFNAKLRVGGTASNGWKGTVRPGMVIVLSQSGNNLLWSEDGITFTIIEPIPGQQPFQLVPASAGNRHYYAFEQNGIIYISSSQGIVAVGRPLPNNPADPEDVKHAGYYMAGVPFGLSTTTQVIDPEFGSGVKGTALEPDRQVAYRYVFGYRDSAGVPHLGAPSTRAVAINPVSGNDAGVTKNVLVKTPIPPGIIKDRNFWQLYRTLPSPSADVDPGDDEALIAEGIVPPDNVISSILRSDNVATAVTVGHHNFTVGQEFNLLTAVAGTDIPGYNLVLGIDNLSGTTRTVWSKIGEAGMWGNTGFTFTIAEPSTATSANAKKTILFVTDPVTKLHYYIENYSPYVYILDADGRYIDKVKLKYLPDNAVYDYDLRTIHIVGRPVDSEPDTFNYTSSTVHPRYIKFSTQNNIVSSSKDMSTIPGAISTPWINPAPVELPNVAATVTKGYMGLWKVRAGATPWTYLAFYSNGRKPIIVATNTDGASWKEFTDVGPNFMGPALVSWNVFGTYYYQITAGDSWKITSGEDAGEFRSAFAMSGIATAPTTFVPPETVGPPILPKDLIDYECQLGVNIYQMENDGNDEPALVIAQRTTHVKLAAETDVSYYDIIKFSALKVLPNGAATALYEYRGSAATRHRLQVYDAAWSYKGFLTESPIFTAAQLIAEQNMADGFPQTVPVGGYTVLSSAALGSQATNKSPIVAQATGYQYADWTLVGLVGNLVYSRFVALAIAAKPGGIAIGTYQVSEVLDDHRFSFVAPGTNFPSTPVALNYTVTSISMLDTVAPTFIGPYLYTSSVAEGAISGNFPPPISEDIALFRTYAFFSNCTQPAAVQITMLDVDIPNGTRIKLAGTDYATAGDTEDILNKTFKVYRGHLETVPTSTLTEDFQNTINSLANVVNSNYAGFLNVIIPVSAGVVDFASFFVRSINGIDNAEFHYLEAAPSSTIIKSNFTPYDIIVAPEAVGNVLYYSKSNIPDAVPLLNSIRIGADSKPIRRIVPARDSLFVFKDDGCFILRGYGPPWQVDPFDLTLQVASRDSLVTLDNAVFGLFTRGCFKVSDSNVELMSLPIQDKLERYMAGDLKQYGDDYGFACADNPDHKYIMWLPLEDQIDSAEMQAYVYDTFTESWVRWERELYYSTLWNETAIVNTSRMNIGENNVTTIEIESRTTTIRDLNDGRRYHTKDMNGGALVALAGVDIPGRKFKFPLTNSFAVQAGDYIVSAGFGDWSALVLENAAPGEWFTVSSLIPDGTMPGMQVSVYRGIRQKVKFAPTFPSSPAASNHFSEYALSFREAYWGDFYLTIQRPIEESDVAESEGIIPFDGIKHFGVQNSPTLLRIATRNFLRTYVPRDQQRGTVIIPGYECRVANFPCKVDGIYIVMTPGPTSFTRR